MKNDPPESNRRAKPLVVGRSGACFTPATIKALVPSHVLRKSLKYGVSVLRLFDITRHRLSAARVTAHNTDTPVHTKAAFINSNVHSTGSSTSAGARAPERALFVLGAMNYESSSTHNWAAACGRGHASWVAGFGRRNSDAAWSHSCVGACGGGNFSRRVAKARVFAFFLMSGFNLEGKNIHVSSFMCVASDRR